MDDGLDDLFGDAPPLQLPDPLPKGLLQRVDELSLSGCCQKLTWSKTGCIAYVSKDGRNIVLRHLLCDSRDGQWRLSKEYSVYDVSNVHNEHQIVHIAWSHTGNELAVTDVFGQISIYNVFLAINRLTVMRRCALDPEDNMSAVIGMMWVYSDRWGFFHNPMQKTNAEGWVFKCSQRKLLGPHNLMQRPALIAVTRAGMIRVLSLGQDGRWQDFKTEIENISSPFEILTHAAICPEKIADKSTTDHDSAVLVATYDNNKELRVYRVKIDFERSRIDIHHLKGSLQFAPFDISDGTLMTDDASLRHTQLSFLEFIPPGPRSGTRELTPPFIFASFTCISDNSEISPGQPLQLTVLCKLELQLKSPKIHPSFESLTSKRANHSFDFDLAGEYILKRSDDVVLSKILLGVHQINMSSILLLMYSDGSIEYRDRSSMDTLPLNVRDQFSTLGQVGFDNPMRKPSLHTTISPNFCAIITLDEEHDAAMSLMRVGNEELLDDSSLEIINEGFVMQGSLAAMTNPSHSDDLLATIQAFANQHLYIDALAGSLPALADSDTFKSHFLSEMYRVLGLQYDYSVDPHPQQIIQNTLIQKCLSIQASIGLAGVSKRPSLPSVVAQTTLELRHVAYTYLLATRSKPGTDSELKNPDSVHFIVGLVSWLMALFGFIVDEIFTLARFLEESGEDLGSNLDLLNQKVRTMNSPALPLLMISSSRTLLRLNCVNMRSLMATTKAQSGSNPLGYAYRELEAVFQKSPITVLQFERLILDLDTSVKGTYQKADISYDDIDHKNEKEVRNNIEKDMLIKATIPDVHLDTVRVLLTTTVKKLQEEVNVAELYFMDIGWLGLTDDMSSKIWREKHPMDGMRKAEIKKGTRTKKCPRCGILTEDVLPYRGVNIMVMSLQRCCLCGSWFMVGEEDNAAQVGNAGF